MKKNLTLVVFLLSLSAWSQKQHDQYSLEAAYGMGISGDPGIIGFSHYEIGFRYMVDQFWGIKFDFGSDRFRTDNNSEPGTDYQRYSVQGVHNLGRTLKMTNGEVKNINLLAHGGLGYSSLKAVGAGRADKIGNVIIGLTPQLYLNNSLAVTFDASYILNFTQQLKFNGLYPPKPEGTSVLQSFTGHLFTASVGLTYYFGKNKSNTDWK